MGHRPVQSLDQWSTGLFLLRQVAQHPSATGDFEYTALLVLRSSQFQRAKTFSSLEPCFISPLPWANHDYLLSNPAFPSNGMRAFTSGRQLGAFSSPQWLAAAHSGPQLIIAQPLLF
jgi:hypothetical protein